MNKKVRVLNGGLTYKLADFMVGEESQIQDC